MSRINYERIYDQIKEEGDSAIMDLIHRMEENSLRQYYPEAVEERCEDCHFYCFTEELNFDGICQDCEQAREEEENEAEDEE